MGSANRGGLGNAPGHSAVATAAASLVNLAAWSASSPRSRSQSGFAWPDCQARIAHAGGAARTAVRGRTGGARAWSGSCVPVSHCAQRGPLRSVPFPQRCRPRPCGDSTAGDSSRRTRALTRADAARFAGFGEGIAEASRIVSEPPARRLLRLREHCDETALSLALRRDFRGRGRPAMQRRPRSGNPQPTRTGDWCRAPSMAGTCSRPARLNPRCLQPRST